LGAGNGTVDLGWFNPKYAPWLARQSHQRLMADRQKGWSAPAGSL